MKLLLIAHFSSLAAQDDVALLNLRGYHAKGFDRLHDSTYPLNAGCVASDLMVHQNLMVELLEGATPVIHPEATVEQCQDVAWLCRYAGVPMVRLADLPACPPENTEVIDALNMCDAPMQELGLQELERMLPVVVARRRTLWDLVRAALAKLERELGYWLKNPMVREQQARPLYPAPDLPLSTTG